MLKGTETITILRETHGPRDEFGQPSILVEEFEVKNCLIAPGAGQVEFGVYSEVDFTVDFTVYTPKRFKMQPQDKVRLRGETFAASEPMRDWVPPKGFRLKTGFVLYLSRGEGGVKWQRT